MVKSTKESLETISLERATEHFRMYGVGLRPIDRKEAPNDVIRSIALGIIYEMLSRGIFSHSAKRIDERVWTVNKNIMSGLVDTGVEYLLPHFGFTITVED